MPQNIMVQQNHKENESLEDDLQAYSGIRRQNF
jgi:hypothetical protein